MPRDSQHRYSLGPFMEQNTLTFALHIIVFNYRIHRDKRRILTKYILISIDQAGKLS